MRDTSSSSTGLVIAGTYRVERLLAEGTTALVVEATHVDLGRRVAIKVLRGDAARAPEVLERFRREAQIAAQLPGDHVARVSDVGMTEAGEPYLVMELLVGRDPRNGKSAPTTTKREQVNPAASSPKKPGGSRTPIEVFHER